MKILNYFLILILISSCGSYTGEFREISSDSFELSLPDWLEETTDLAPHATYQFKSMYRNTYGIVVKDAIKQTSFKEYQKDAVNVLFNFDELTNVLITDSVIKENRIKFELMGDMQGEKIFYWHNTYKSSDNYYQLIMWTRSYDRKQKYTDVIDKIIDSFSPKE